MSDKPQDPAQESIDQHERGDESFEGQQGYGVEFEDGRYRSDNMQAPPERGRSGSYETANTGGYGAAPDSTGGRLVEQQPTVPPDPEAQQGQGGQ